MKRILTLLAVAAVATALTAPGRAEMLQQSKEPSTVEKVEKMTRAQWMKLQAGYKKQKAKYTACNDKAKAEKLRGRKRWGSIYECMQGS
jgi:phosphate-selective porin